MAFLSDAAWLSLVGLSGGVALGLAARLGRFCSLGAIEDALFAGDFRRARMWALAVAVAIAGCFWCEAAGVVDLAAARPLVFVWNPIASVLGGLLFGYGMALVGTCGFGSLARLGGGDLRGLVILFVTGAAAYIAATGVGARLYAAVFPVERLAQGDWTPGLAHLLGDALLLSPGAVAAPIALSIAIAALSDRAFRHDWRAIAWSVMVGVVAAGGFAATGAAASRSFGSHIIESYSFTAPLGETILYAMTSAPTAPGFAVASVAGVVLGGAIGALLSNEFRWEACDDARELRRQIVGAAFMGVGGVIAFGCAIGQGLSAFGVLALSAPTVLAAIFVGAWLGLNSLIIGAHGLAGGR